MRTTRMLPRPSSSPGRSCFGAAGEGHAGERPSDTRPAAPLDRMRRRRKPPASMTTPPTTTRLGGAGPLRSRSSPPRPSRTPRRRRRRRASAWAGHRRAVAIASGAAARRRRVLDRRPGRTPARCRLAELCEVTGPCFSYRLSLAAERPPAARRHRHAEPGGQLRDRDRRPRRRRCSASAENSNHVQRRGVRGRADRRHVHGHGRARSRRPTPRSACGPSSRPLPAKRVGQGRAAAAEPHGRCRRWSSGSSRRPTAERLVPARHGEPARSRCWRAPALLVHARRERAGRGGRRRRRRLPPPDVRSDERRRRARSTCGSRSSTTSPTATARPGATSVGPIYQAVHYSDGTIEAAPGRHVHLPHHPRPLPRREHPHLRAVPGDRRERGRLGAGGRGHEVRASARPTSSSATGGASTSRPRGYFGEGDNADGRTASPPPTACSGSPSGWGDVYRWQRPGQYVEFAGNGDGLYVVRATVDKANHILEANETDNSSYTLVRIVARDGRHHRAPAAACHRGTRRRWSPGTAPPHPVRSGAGPLDT